MDRIHTASGAVYDVDWEAGRVRRRGPDSPGIKYDEAPDDTWLFFLGATSPISGLRMQFAMPGGFYRSTTPVVKVEADVEEESDASLA